MHRNTFINSPTCLNADFSLKQNGQVFFAGQITGVEGYVESSASGLLCAVHMLKKLKGEQPIIPESTTIMGALSRHIADPNEDFQPMNANYGILPPLEVRVRDKKERYKHLSERAIESIKNYVKEL
jgi:methylenetetrahydrofolate--tRNA-(uracil-5-)-methyltransferase